jgi:hypothetical protein
MSSFNTAGSENSPFTSDIQRMQIIFEDSVDEWIHAVHPTSEPLSVPISDPNLRKCINVLYSYNPSSWRLVTSRYTLLEWKTEEEAVNPSSQRVGTPPDSLLELKIEEEATQPDSSLEKKIEEEAAKLIRIVIGETAGSNENEDFLLRKVMGEPEKLDRMFEKLFFLMLREGQHKEHMTRLTSRLKEPQGN